MSSYRTASGGRIKRWHPLRFTFDGRSYTGFEGDTLASALLANGVHLVGRSFKYHRPRGIMGAGTEEPNALVEIDRGGGRRTPNLLATQVELYEGLVARSQNRWPTLARDIGAAADGLSRFLPAGFYYKTFKWPGPAWRHLYEPAIRRAAGLGRAPPGPDPDRYTQRFAHCEVLVVGAGPAGLAAARAAAGTGLRVIVCDEQAEFGGSLLADLGAEIEGERADVWLAGALRALSTAANVTLLRRTTAFGYYQDNFVALAERLTDHTGEPAAGLPRERLWQVRAREVVLATGALERPLVFPGNDRPGVMLAGAARTYLTRYGVRAGRRAVLATAHDSGYRAALDLHNAGVEIAAIADLRSAPAGRWHGEARKAGLRIETDSSLVGTKGRLRVKAATLGRLGRGGVWTGETVACDLVLNTAGWTPAVHLFSQARGRLTFDERLQAFVPASSVQRERSAGACRGTFDLAAAIAEGAAAGAAAAAHAAHGAGHRGSARPAPRSDGAALAAPRTAPRGAGGVRSETGADAASGDRADAGFVGASPFAAAEPGKAFVDFQNDVTLKDLALAVREGFRAIEHTKRYTTTGQATDQGKTSNVNALAIVAALEERPIAEVGHTTFRAPYTPVTFGTLAALSRGELFEPIRLTPTHASAVEQGAVFEDVGAWKRARYFPIGREDMETAVAREVRAVRSAVGLFDASTLGKIEVTGPDAAAFLDRIYVNNLARLGVGRCRYALMLREDGFILDDGIVARLAADRFHVTTTTGGAARVLALMEDYLQTEWPDLRVWLTSITEQWAVVAVQGPRAAEVLAPLVADPDLLALPHMSVAETDLRGLPARLFRVSFTGDRGYEVNVPADYGRALWEALHARVAALGGAAYGTEAMHVLRAEKGYIIVGQETDGTVTPDDVGLGGMVGRSKPDFIGKRSLARPDLVAPGRKQLVGLLTADPATVLEEGAQVTDRPDPPKGSGALGHVTSAYHSPTVGRSIALALVAGGRGRLNEQLFVPMPGGPIPVTVTTPVFFDPEGARLHG